MDLYEKHFGLEAAQLTSDERDNERSNDVRAMLSKKERAELRKDAVKELKNNYDAKDLNNVITKIQSQSSFRRNISAVIRNSIMSTFLGVWWIGFIKNGATLERKDRLKELKTTMKLTEKEIIKAERKNDEVMVKQLNKFYKKLEDKAESVSLESLENIRSNDAEEIESLRLEGIYLDDDEIGLEDIDDDFDESDPYL